MKLLNTAKKITAAAALVAALLAGTAPKAAAQCPYTVGPLGRYIAPAIVQGMTATDDGAVEVWCTDALDGDDWFFTVDAKTAPTVRFIFEHYAAGESSTSIVEQLNAKGLRTSQGNPFNKCSIPVSSRMKCTAVSIPARRTTCGSRARSPLSLMMIYGRGRKL